MAKSHKSRRHQTSTKSLKAAAKSSAGSNWSVGIIARATAIGTKKRLKTRLGMTISLVRRGASDHGKTALISALTNATSASSKTSLAWLKCQRLWSVGISTLISAMSSLKMWNVSNSVKKYFRAGTSATSSASLSVSRFLKRTRRKDIKHLVR